MDNLKVIITLSQLIGIIEGLTSDNKSKFITDTLDNAEKVLHTCIYMNKDN